MATSAKAAKSVKAVPGSLTTLGAPVDMRFRKTTKHTHVYGTDADGVVADTIYLKKSEFPDPDKPPRSIRLTVEFGA